MKWELGLKAAPTRRECLPTDKLRKKFNLQEIEDSTLARFKLCKQKMINFKTDKKMFYRCLR